MKSKFLKTVIVLFALILLSCEETVVTNIIHPDGSVTRRIVIRDGEARIEDYKAENCRVPYDSTWSITDTFETNDKGDTTWVRKAEKLFKNVAEINEGYVNDSGTNRNFKREAVFSRKFRWFSTVYRFSENIDNTLLYGLPVNQFLNKEELEYFYLPDNILTERRDGPDSTRVKQIEDSISAKSDKWIESSCLSEWQQEFLILSEKNKNGVFSKELLKNKYPEMIYLIEKARNDSGSFNYDSIVNVIVMNAFGDELYNTYKTEIDSATKILETRFDEASSFDGYSMRTLMPGNMVATNGYPDQNGEILWPVKMELFLTSRYEMWAESKTTNTWAWVVSGIFVLFVVAGLIIRVFRR